MAGTRISLITARYWWWGHHAETLASTLRAQVCGGLVSACSRAKHAVLTLHTLTLVQTLRAQVCGEAGVSVQPRTASARDGMLRAGAEAAADAAMQASGAQLGGMPPSRFVTGLARDLGARPLPRPCPAS